MEDKKQFLVDREVLEIYIQRMKPRYLKDKNEFEKCSTGVERINFFLNDKEELAYIISEIKRIQPSPTKSDEKAVEMKNIGNDYYRKGLYGAAIAYYNRSLSWAEGAEMVSFAYSNRSAACFALGFYEQCLMDIDNALKHGYPEKQKSKLIKRKEDAEKAQTGSKKVFKTIEIPESEKNELIQSARNCIEIQTNDQYGRHIVATRDIKIGEILAVEKVYSVTLRDCSTETYFFCCECLEHCYQLIPCPHCPERLYCSELCKENAFKKYHKYECLIMPYMRQLIGVLADLFFIPLKYTLMAMTDENNDEIGYRSDRYKEISKLESHSNEDSPEKLHVLALFNANVFTLMKEKTNIFKDFEGSEERFKELFFRHLQIFKVNCVDIESFVTEGDYCMSVHGTGLYSLYSLFNHSCYPNTFWYACGSTMIIRAFSTIKKGEQCFISYGVVYPDDDRIERQEKMQRQYKFTCRCAACEENWPKMTFPTVSLGCKNNEEVKTKLDQMVQNLTCQKTPPSENALILRNLIKKGYQVLDNKSAAGDRV